MNFNICTLTDSYKMGHHNQYPKNTQKVYSYFESREGAKYPETTFFGLQLLLKEFLEGPVVTKEKIDAAEKLAARHFGNDKIFNRARWDYILEKHKGYLPVLIKAVPEGTVVPVSNVLMTIENTDPNCYWLTNHLETLLCHVWSTSTVATLSANIKKIFAEYLDVTCDQGKDFPGINFMLHDFGMRGVSSMMSAGFEGAGHLINFLGTDTVIAMEVIEQYYGGYQTGYSVPATEHSIMTSLGREGEKTIIGQLIDNYPDGILSIVSDSYDIYDCVKNIYGNTFKHKILARNGKLVVRPDSGDPVITTHRVLDLLWEAFGGTINGKGFKVLNPKIGVLWGDGIDEEGIVAILEMMKAFGYSAENIVFGMGGALLQKINRDTQRFAFKSSYQERLENGEVVGYNIFKDPIDGSKKSKKGRLMAAKTNDGHIRTLEQNPYLTDLLEIVFANGKIIKEYTFEEVIQNSRV